MNVSFSVAIYKITFWYPLRPTQSTISMLCFALCLFFCGYSWFDRFEIWFGMRQTCYNVRIEVIRISRIAFARNIEWNSDSDTTILSLMLCLFTFCSFGIFAERAPTKNDGWAPAASTWDRPRVLLGEKHVWTTNQSMLKRMISKDYCDRIEFTHSLLFHCCYE